MEVQNFCQIENDLQAVKNSAEFLHFFLVFSLIIHQISGAGLKKKSKKLKTLG